MSFNSKILANPTFCFHNLAESALEAGQWNASQRRLFIPNLHTMKRDEQLRLTELMGKMKANSIVWATCALKNNKQGFYLCCFNWIQIKHQLTLVHHEITAEASIEECTDVDNRLLGSFDILLRCNNSCMSESNNNWLE
jgi:hypothetical protein